MDIFFTFSIHFLYCTVGGEGRGEEVDDGSERIIYNYFTFFSLLVSVVPNISHLLDENYLIVMDRGS